MKRIISFVLVVTVLLTCGTFPPMSVFAGTQTENTSPKLLLTPSQTEFAGGDIFTVTVSTLNNPGICGVWFNVNFGGGLELINYAVSADFIAQKPSLSIRTCLKSF